MCVCAARVCVHLVQFGEIDIDSSLITKKEVLEGTQDTITTLANGEGGKGRCVFCVCEGGGEGGVDGGAKPLA